MLKVYITNIKKISDNKLFEEVISNISVCRKEKYDATNNEELKLQILVSSYLIDKYLKTFGLREKDMRYGLTASGKPYFENKKNIYFSISHSKDIVGVAFSEKDVGFDVQVVKNVSDKIYNRVLSDSEKEDAFSAQNENEKLNNFFRYWVMKEAILKRDGTGIKSDIKSVSDNFGIVGTLDGIDELDSIDKYYYCANNAFDKELKLNIV